MNAAPLAVCLLSMGLAAPAALGQESSGTDIGSRRQFWFNAQPLVAESSGLRIAQQRPVKNGKNPFLLGDRPWEGNIVQLYSCDVHHDPETGRWQMWYEGHPGCVLLCTAFSKDGLRWEKPSLGLETWKGSKDNNIILQTGYTDAHCAAIVKAPTEKDPARKYKLYYWVGPQWMDSHIEPLGLKPAEVADAKAKIKPYKKNGHYVAFSSDGVTFTPRSDAPVLATSDFSTVLFDEQLGRYRSYHKIEHQLPGWKQIRRCMWESQSDDGVTFEKSRLVLAPDEKDDTMAKTLYAADRVEFYGMHVWPQDGFYLGLVWIFTITKVNPKYGMGWDDGHIQPHLIYSPDGLDWKRLPVREPFIPNGPEGSWDSGTLYSSGDHPVVLGNEVRFYYFGTNYTHGSTEPIVSAKNRSGFGVATLPRDRYVGWQAAKDSGTLLTKPITFSGKDLFLNVDASHGVARVALLSADNQPIPGFGLEECEPIKADSLEQAVRWAGASASALAGKTVRLQFSLRQSTLYTWQFK
ncbi:MAG TPA: hypothetical protein VNM14_07890 [Planctomycetota bacterium]|nr:hypothetical protein [Planctomycetota bacterium]